MLAVASVLNWTVVTYGFLAHHAESEPDEDTETQTEGSATGALEAQTIHQSGSSDVMAFDDLFDRQALQPLVRLITLQEARAAGWSGVLDRGFALRFDYNRTLPLVARVGVRLAPNDTMRHGAPFSCDPVGLRRFAASACGHPRVHWFGLFAYRRLLPPARTSMRRVMAMNTPCSRAYLQIAKAWSKAPAIMQAADAFIAQRLGGGAYVALHVRPYPDTCLRYWQNITVHSYNLTEAFSYCRQPHYFLNMTSHVLQAAARLGLPAEHRTFVMAHPAVRELVASRFVQAGLRRPHFASDGALPLALRAHPAATSLLSVLEQEVCRRASVFIGTRYSSMSVNTAQERIAAAGRIDNSTMLL